MHNRDRQEPGYIRRMCGIGGILRTYPPGVAVPPREESIREEWLDILDDSIKHRGPDGSGRFRDRVVRADGTTVDVALIHRRMAIIDLEGGHQPMLLREERRSGSGGVSPGTEACLHSLPGETPGLQRAPDQLAVVFNGCIYNHRELRKELEGLGAEFRTDHSDTEVLLWGWRKWGRRMSSRLEGMFAYALWDRQAGTLEVLREEYREKPLWCVNRLLAHAGYEERYEGTHFKFDIFGSVPAGVLRVHAATKHFDEQQVDNGSAVGKPCPGTFRTWIAFGNGTHFLGPATGSARCLRAIQPFEVCRDHIHTVRHINLRQESVDAVLDEAVRARLIADRPLGCFLSGGVDSSLIAMYAKRHLPELQTFCMRMPDARFDESSYAKDVSEHLGTHHTTLDVECDVAQDLVAIIEEVGAPFADSSLLPTMWLCRAAKQHVTVALAGDGGDELFGGYERHLAAPIIEHWWWLLQLVPKRLLAGGGPKSIVGKVQRLCQVSRDHSLAANSNMLLRRLWSNEQIRVLFAEQLEQDFYSGVHSMRFRWSLRKQLRRAVKDPHAAWANSVSDALHDDINNYLPEDILFKTDSASMHSALEVRAPFLDSKVAALARSATIDSLMPNGQRKGLLRAVARKYFPPEIVDRPKMGFAIPLAEWFRTDFGGLRTLLGDLVINATDPYPADIMGCELNRVFIRELFDQHMSGKRDHAQRLYALLVMAIWCWWYRRISRS